jgi:hypothetical protein
VTALTDSTELNKETALTGLHFDAPVLGFHATGVDHAVAANFEL